MHLFECKSSYLFLFCNAEIAKLVYFTHKYLDKSEYTHFYLYENTKIPEIVCKKYFLPFRAINH